MRVAVVDIGTNSTRLLIADVDAREGSVAELARRSNVTRLGAGVDADGTLAPEACERVYSRLDEYERTIALDPKTHHIFSVGTEKNDPVPPTADNSNPRPRPVSSTFTLVEIGR